MDLLQRLRRHLSLLADNMVRQVAVNRLQGGGCELRNFGHLAGRHAFGIHDESVAQIPLAGEL